MSFDIEDPIGSGKGTWSWWNGQSCLGAWWQTEIQVWIPHWWGDWSGQYKEPAGIPRQGITFTSDVLAIYFIVYQDVLYMQTLKASLSDS